VRCVVNTNVRLVSISPKSKYHWIYQSLISKRYDLLVTTDILLEYQEIVSKKYNKRAAKLLLETLDSLPNVRQKICHYHWYLIEQDPDDNKFVDCAISGNADHLITEDKDFNILKSIDFPKISVLTILDFELALRATTE